MRPSCPVLMRIPSPWTLHIDSYTFRLPQACKGFLPAGGTISFTLKSPNTSTPRGGDPWTNSSEHPSGWRCMSAEAAARSAHTRLGIRYARFAESSGANHLCRSHRQKGPPAPSPADGAGCLTVHGNASVYTAHRTRAALPNVLIFVGRESRGRGIPICRTGPTPRFHPGARPKISPPNYLTYNYLYRYLPYVERPQGSST